jgi:hypothetical protein
VTVTDLPELVPARMLNEYAYCPRLFFLEWVDSLWASNADVAEGDRRHRRADAGGGAAPLPEDGEVKAARSVELASEWLDIVAKLCDPCLGTPDDDPGAPPAVRVHGELPASRRAAGPDPGRAPDRRAAAVRSRS